MPDTGYLETTIHHFKTHISDYIRRLERGECRAVIVKRGSRRVGLFMPINPPPPKNDIKNDGTRPGEDS